MTDFILECSPKVKKSAPLKADSLAEVLQALRTHKAVAWVRRQSTGAAKIQGRYIQFGGRRFVATSAIDVFNNLRGDHEQRGY